MQPTMAAEVRRSTMHGVKVEALMSRQVVVATPELPLKAVAALLTANRISGVPVEDDDGRVLGVVSEADLLRKEQGLSPEVTRRFRWLLRRLDGEVDKLRARTAGEAMTSPPLTVAPGEDVTEAARAMLEHGVNRLPVVDGRGRLVGIVTRADLVRAFGRGDGEIEREIHDLLRHDLWLDVDRLDLAVDDGVVTIAGPVDTDLAAATAETWIRRVPGVVDVVADLQPRVDTRGGRLR